VEKDANKEIYKPTAKETRIQVVKFLLFSISAGIIETTVFTLLKLITPWSYRPVRSGSTASSSTA
jgi:hypothetical protein